MSACSSQELFSSSSVVTVLIPIQLSTGARALAQEHMLSEGRPARRLVSVALVAALGCDSNDILGSEKSYYTSLNE